MPRCRSSSEAPATVLLALVVVVAGATVGAAETPGAIAVVVGRESPIDGVDVDTLRGVYLRRQRLWTSGERTMPVNLPADSALRHAFSTRVLGRQPRELVGYWRRLYFDGIRPPLVLKTPRAVCAYVRAEPGAIGYVPPDAVDPALCRVVLVLGAAS